MVEVTGRGSSLNAFPLIEEARSAGIEIASMLQELYKGALLSEPEQEESDDSYYSS